MKIGCSVDKLSTIFSDFSESVDSLVSGLDNIRTLPKSLEQQELYKIDRSCMRNRFFNDETGKRNTKVVTSRFFECMECSRFKVYKEMVDLDNVTDLVVKKYDNVSQIMRVEHNSVLSDTFTNLVIINQKLMSDDLAGVDFPINAFVCGNVGFIYYSYGDKSKIYDGLYEKLLTGLDNLKPYKFTFNSLPVKSFTLLKSSKINRSNLYLRIPINSSITTKEGINLRNYELFDLVVPGDLTKKEKDHFILFLDTQPKIKKFKYLRAIYGLDDNINYTLNVILFFICLEKEFNLNMKKHWDDMWVDKVNLDHFKGLNDYDQFLKLISGKKIKYLM